MRMRETRQNAQAEKINIKPEDIDRSDLNIFKVSDGGSVNLLFHHMMEWYPLGHLMRIVIHSHTHSHAHSPAQSDIDSPTIVLHIVLLIVILIVLLIVILIVLLILLLIVILILIMILIEHL